VRGFLLLSALLAFAFGSALLVMPGPFLAPMGIVATPAVAVSGQAQGAILIGLGVINLLARKLTMDAVRPVLVGNLVVQALSLLVIGRALVGGLVPVQNAGAVVIHAALGAGFAYFVIRTGRGGL
jgi:hypothetical protein